MVFGHADKLLLTFGNRIFVVGFTTFFPPATELVVSFTEDTVLLLLVGGAMLLILELTPHQWVRRYRRCCGAMVWLQCAMSTFLTLFLFLALGTGVPP